MKTEVITYKKGTTIPTPKGGKIIDITPMQDGTCQVTVQLPEPIDPSVFIKIEASQLSLSDSIFDLKQMGMLMPDPSEWPFVSDSLNTLERQNKLRTRKLYNSLQELIKTGQMHDFYRPKYDPSLDELGNLVFEPGKMPEVGHTFAWWDKAAKDFMPQRNSRLGNLSEYNAFLGVLIKKLVESGKSVRKAWEMVCFDSAALGHFANNRKTERPAVEETGSREVCGFCDLGNVKKMFALTKGDRLWTTNSSYKTSSFKEPLNSWMEIDLYEFYKSLDHPGSQFYDKPDSIFNKITGWIVLS